MDESNFEKQVESKMHLVGKIASKDGQEYLIKKIIVDEETETISVAIQVGHISSLLLTVEIGKFEKEFIVQ